MGGGTLTLDDLAETLIGDWLMPAFKTACAHAVSQGWLVVEDDVLTLTTAGLSGGIGETRIDPRVVGYPAFASSSSER
jgi:hypothetical protein